MYTEKYDSLSELLLLPLKYFYTYFLNLYIIFILNRVKKILFACKCYSILGNSKNSLYYGVNFCAEQKKNSATIIINNILFISLAIGTYCIAKLAVTSSGIFWRRTAKVALNSLVVRCGHTCMTTNRSLTLTTFFAFCGHA